ncbi:alpha/beta-Hydrolases superfamily protein [Striga hermonthica]|uniref:Alpha/beta-Hydrolases superfamily protein n=1 Tax=Striga hermonthica TaxID=68872 RepID=A0A9N7NTS5_STRHE|nr:alpha/beta-Hydrolases superfamily protein [Striga hermonthica]
MKVATRVVSPPALKARTAPNFTSTPNSSITSSWNPDCGKSKPSKSNHNHSLTSQSLRDKWMEVQGIRNWEGLLDPLDNTLRDEILRYGDFVEAAYRAFFNSDEPCRLIPRGYTITRSLHATGFLSMYTTEGEDGRPSLRDEVRDEVARVVARYGGDVSVTVTGHSLGAALATLTGHDVGKEFGGMVTVVSFGGPRIGNKAFREELEKNGTRVLRIVNADDPVTKVPGFVLNDNSEQVGGMRWMEETEWVYAEIGKELRLSSRSGGVATCHDLKTYLKLVDNCPLRATARRVLSPKQLERRRKLVC